ncbi:hypothetical protein [Streptomyces sp. NPDC091268]
MQPRPTEEAVLGVFTEFRRLLRGRSWSAERERPPLVVTTASAG